MLSIINKAKSAFSFIELSVVLVIIGVLFIGVSQMRSIIFNSRLAAARSLTAYSPVAEINGLQLWLETTLEDSFDNYDSLNDGDTISTWYDLNPQSTTKYDATIGNAPSYIKRSNINNLPVLSFDGSSDYLEVLNFPHLDSYDAYFVVMGDADPQSGIGDNPVISKNESLRLEWDNSSNFASYGAAALVDTGDGFVGVKFGSSSPWLNGKTPYILSMSYDYGTRTISSYRNGVDVSSPDTPPGILNSPDSVNTILTIAKRPNAADYWSGDIAEIIIYNRPLSDNERQDVEDYLSRKWGIELE